MPIDPTTSQALHDPAVPAAGPDSGAPVSISVKNIGKCYHIYANPQDRLKQTLLGRFGNYYREFWAVRDVSFDLRRGEALGIIGRNGSGKSTLLQLITGTLKPTVGSVSVHGRVAALLELGSGFNPEFTGRENVYLNGALLGLKRVEIDDRFDRIAGFADIGSFIDQPVKTYSSGMLVRLAFAVQVQIEPDVLIVDEALAVGDALFQKRCFAQLEKLTANGTSVLFVSHDQEAMRTLTHRAILLSGGEMKSTGTSAQVLLDYRKLLHDEESAYFNRANVEMARKVPSPGSLEVPANLTGRSDRFAFGDRDAEVIGVTTLNDAGEPASLFHPMDRIRIRIECQIHKPLTHLNVGLRIRSKEGLKVYSWGTLNQDIAIASGHAVGEKFWEKSFTAGQRVVVDFDCPCRLGTNLYEVQGSITEEGKPYYGEQRMLHWIDEAAFFHVMVKDREYFFGGAFDLQMKAQWSQTS